MIIRTESDRHQVITRISRIDLDKGAWEVDGYPLGKAKTDAQRGKFHALCRELALQIGETEGTVKALAKAKLMGTRQVKFHGLEITVPDSDSSERYSKKQYSQLIEILYWLASEAEVSIDAGSL